MDIYGHRINCKLLSNMCGFLIICIISRLISQGSLVYNLNSNYIELLAIYEIYHAYS